MIDPATDPANDPTADWPQSWTWANGPVSAGGCVLVDVDGVIADGWHRQPCLRQDKPDWKSFFARADADTPIEGSRGLVSQLGASATLVLLTARPQSLRQVTVDWLGEHGFVWDLLVLRARSDSRYSSPDFKRRSVADLRARGFEPTLALDDDHRNVEMFRSEGIETLYVHSGYYEVD